MVRQILYMSEFDVAGISHAICCQWIKQSCELGSVTAVRQLISSDVTFPVLDAAGGWQGINGIYQLPVRELFSRPRLDSAWLAERSTRINGYALILLGGGGVGVQSESHRKEGHTLAVRKQPGNIQYFDPNVGTLQFDYSSDLRDWLLAAPSAPSGLYPELRNRECKFAKV
jgi:hypothetical protein